MRILHVEGGRNFYGGAHQVLLLVEGLKKRGIENLVACRTGSELADAARPHAQVFTLTMRGDLDIGLIQRLHRLIDQTRPDLVHLHSRIGADIMGGIAARLAGVPVVHSRRQDNPESRLTVALKYRLHDYVIAISEGIGRILISEGLPPGKLRIARDAIDSAPFQHQPEHDWFHAEFGIPDSVTVIGVVAQLIERKGHRILLDGLPLLLRSHPDLRVIFFGKGSMESELRRRMEELKLNQNVLFAGFRDDLPRILPCLDLVVHPALMEGLGVSLLQAAASGLPIVASRVGGIPEAVQEGVTGLLVEPGDHQALIQAISRLLDDRRLARQMGEAGRERVQRHFSPDTMVEANLSVYRESLAQTSTPG